MECDTVLSPCVLSVPNPVNTLDKHLGTMPGQTKQISRNINKCSAIVSNREAQQDALSGQTETKCTEDDSLLLQGSRIIVSSLIVLCFLHHSSFNIPINLKTSDHHSSHFHFSSLPGRAFNELLTMP